MLRTCQEEHNVAHMLRRIQCCMHVKKDTMLHTCWKGHYVARMLRRTLYQDYTEFDMLFNESCYYLAHWIYAYISHIRKCFNSSLISNPTAAAFVIVSPYCTSPLICNPTPLVLARWHYVVPLVLSLSYSMGLAAYFKLVSRGESKPTSTSLNFLLELNRELS